MQQGLLFIRIEGPASCSLCAGFFFPIADYLTYPQHRRPIDLLFAVLAAFAITSWRRGAEQKLIQRVGT